MTDSYAALREAAEKATPGPWHVEEYDVTGLTIQTEKTAKEAINVIECGYWWGATPMTCDEDNYRYIAAASPDVVLGLLDRIAELENTIESHAAQCDAGDAKVAALREMLAKREFYDGMCLECGIYGGYDDPPRHARDCKLAALLETSA